MPRHYLEYQDFSTRHSLMSEFLINDLNRTYIVRRWCNPEELRAVDPPDLTRLQPTSIAFSWPNPDLFVSALQCEVWIQPDVIQKYRLFKTPINKVSRRRGAASLRRELLCTILTKFDRRDIFEYSLCHPP